MHALRLFKWAMAHSSTTCDTINQHGRCGPQASTGQLHRVHEHLCLQWLSQVMEQLLQERLLKAALLLKLCIVTRSGPGLAVAHRQVCKACTGRRNRQNSIYVQPAIPCSCNRLAAGRSCQHLVPLHITLRNYLHFIYGATLAAEGLLGRPACAALPPRVGTPP
jgi:hypothetical protein